MKWLDDKEIERLKRLSFSTNLNPIKHIWDEKSKNEAELRQALAQYLHSSITKKLLNSDASRLNEVTRTNAYPTRN